MNKQIIEKKIFNHYQLPSFESLLRDWRDQDQKLVFTNGCFDILHAGHISYLSEAAEFGERMIIGLNTDASVSRLKGSNRPVNNQQARAILLASLFFVDAVVLFDEDTPYALIEMVQPDVLVKGGDYTPDKIVGQDIVKAKNGKVIVLELVDGYSTSRIIQKL